MKFLVGISDYVTGAEIERTAFPEAEFVVWDKISAHLNDPRVAELDSLLIWHEKVDDALLHSLKNCKVIVRYGVGFDNVDLEAVKRRKIVFCNNPDYGTEEVADTAVAMILNLLRGVSKYDVECRSYEKGWQENTWKEIRRINCMTLGVVGVGRIGTAVINRIRPFGMKILGFDPYVPSGHEKAVGYQRCSDLSELLRNSDVVSLHCPLTAETSGLVDAGFIGSMKSKSVLVNTARGKLVKSLNVIFDGLKNDKLLAVGLDVLPEEPPLREHPLIQNWARRERWLNGRVLINPHSAYYSKEAWNEMRFKCAETARIFLKSGRARNLIH